MGLFSFIKEAGEKLFGHKEETAEISIEERNRLNQAAAQAIYDRITLMETEIRAWGDERDLDPARQKENKP